jgi:DNA-binding HxlR family transcriptional regulator
MSNQQLLRDRILQALANEKSGRLRFSELHEAIGCPSKGHFSATLKVLAEENLVKREETDYKWVEYVLNRKAYQALLEKQQAALQDKIAKVRDV